MHLVRSFTLEYWRDDGWYVGRLRKVPGVFSQGETLEELEENVRDAYRLMMEDEAEGVPQLDTLTEELAIEV
jgi:predicted RNase H-like HicB family nuclease